MTTTASTPPARIYNDYSDAQVREDTHQWVPKQPGDARSPCPALNTLANHGYLPHDGKQLTAPILIHALQEGYGLSTPLAHFIVYGGIYLLGQVGAFCLKDLARHNRIEHDASLAHDDTKGRDEYAPISPDLSLVQKLMLQAQDGRDLTAEDMARARVERESICPVLNGLHSEIARGEMAIVLGVFGQVYEADHHQGVPLDMLREWLTEERLPDGWKPTHMQGLLQTIRNAWEIRSLMTTFKDEEVAGNVRAQPDGFKLEIPPIS